MSDINYKAILESISDGVFTVDDQWKITSFNRAAEVITGVSRTEAMGSFCSEVFRSSICGDQCALRQTLETGTPLINRGCHFINSDGPRFPVSLSTAVIKDDNGVIIGGAETFRDMSEVENLRARLKGDFSIGTIQSRSSAMKSVFELIKVVAPASATVLIIGDTGTGKEVTAKAIHSQSGRDNEPFVAVNCAALPDTLLESELFGHVKGAFTGATANKEGLFKRAGKGTLFLDEIGDISPALQVRLLRVLQEREFEPLGSNTTVKSEARIVAATNKNLKDLVAKGEFREDLYYRLNVVHIELPSLKERKDDIPLLVEQFISQFNARYDLAIPGISPDTCSALQRYDWPGNIRELENTIERATIVCGGNQIDSQHLPPDIIKLLHPSSTPTGEPSNFYSSRDGAEKHSILAALAETSTKQAAADLLGIHKTTLFKKIKKYEIEK